MKGIRLLLIALLVAPRPVTPAVITVDGQPDDPTPGVCDLVEAIENANHDAATHGDCAAGSGADEIRLTVDTTLTAVDNDGLAGATGLPAVSSMITIEGYGHTVQRDAGASEEFRIFLVDSGGDLTLDGVVVSGGLAASSDLASTGAGIHNRGVLTLTNSTVSGNSAAAPTDGVVPYAYGGGIYNQNSMTLTNSTVTDNSASSGYYAYGGGIFNGGTATLSESTVSDNTVTTTGDAPFRTIGGGGLAQCNAYVCPGTPSTSLIRSTVSGNRAIASSAGVDAFFTGAYGGGILSSDGDLVITNSTISSNTAEAIGEMVTIPLASGGGILVFPTGGLTTLTNSTLSGNAVLAPYGDAVGGAVAILGRLGRLTATSSLIGNSTGDNCSRVDAGADAGGNLADDGTCGTFPDTLVGLDPSLLDNGGPTRTHALEGGSNAIDLANGCGLSTDQRGSERAPGSCDSGSYEFGCSAVDGETEALELDLLTGELTVEVCGTVTVGPDYEIVGPDGHLILRAGRKVELVDGFSVSVGGRLTVEIDPNLQL